jgi:hypothetical protein
MMKSIDYDHVEDKVFKKIDKKMREILELVKDHPEYSFACYFSKYDEKEDMVKTFSVVNGDPDHIVGAIHCDVENSITIGDTSLYEGIFNMILDVLINQDDNETTPTGVVLH